MKAKRRKSTFSKSFLVIISIVILGFGIAVFNFKTDNFNLSPINISFTRPILRAYQNSQAGLTINFFSDWKIESTTYIFENGDLVAFVKKGPTQRDRTDFYDGGRLVISKPFIINQELKAWIKQYHKTSSVKNSQTQYTQDKIASIPFEKVSVCSTGGCENYYYTQRNSNIVGVYTFAGGKDRLRYERDISRMLATLKFTNLKTITPQEAVDKVKNLPEVKEYLKNVPQGKVNYDHEETESNSLVIQVYELKSGHTATFNWYKVNKSTGAVKAEF